MIRLTGLLPFVDELANKNLLKNYPNMYKKIKIKINVVNATIFYY